MHLKKAASLEVILKKERTQNLAQEIRGQ